MRIRWPALSLISAMVLVLGLAGCGFGNNELIAPSPYCQARLGEETAAINVDQAHYAALIAGVSVRRGLIPRAASIGLATAFQESDLRNLNYGDRDSLGLFQQRPSMGWGTPEQIMNPYYSTGKFYDALVKVHDWETGDINDMAQKVQRSGVPEGYRRHIPAARTLASALTGETPAALTCVAPGVSPGNSAELTQSLNQTFGLSPTAARTSPSGTASAPAPITVTVTSGRTPAWAIASHAIANLERFGVDSVAIADRRWTHDRYRLAGWETVEAALPANQIVITLRPPSS